MNRTLKNIVYHAPRLLSDRRFIECIWELKFGYKLDLNYLKSFNNYNDILKVTSINELHNALFV